MICRGQGAACAGRVGGGEELWRWRVTRERAIYGPRREDSVKDHLAWLDFLLIYLFREILVYLPAPWAPIVPGGIQTEVLWDSNSVFMLVASTEGSDLYLTVFCANHSASNCLTKRESKSGLNMCDWPANLAQHMTSRYKQYFGKCSLQQMSLCIIFVSSTLRKPEGAGQNHTGFLG